MLTVTYRSKYMYIVYFQDVMLSATTTQSPLATQSSVFTMPSVTMGSTGLNLTDHLFLPGVSTLDTTQNSTDLKTEQNGRLTNGMLGNFLKIDLTHCSLGYKMAAMKNLSAST